MSAHRRMSAGDLVRYALIRAIQDRLSYADCWPANAPERAEALDEVRQFRSYMKRRFGTSQTPIEQAVDGVPSVSLHDLSLTPRAPITPTPAEPTAGSAAEVEQPFREANLLPPHDVADG